MVFGYRMELGDIVPSPNEAETVRYIYTRYLAGASFQCLANELNQKALPYHTGKSWNKNMVARILEDSRYVGAGLYPPIISAEQLQAVRERRRQNCTASPPLPAQAELYKLCGSAVPGSAVKRICTALNHLIDYWKKQASNADLNLVRGKKFTRSVCNGLANSGERSMVIRAKATREVLTMVAYNGKGNIEANQSITFTYTDGTEGAISNYTAAPTPGSTEDGQVTGTYTFTKGPVPAPTAEAVQSANEACC